MIWNEPIECMSRDEMQALQSRRLKNMVNQVYHNVPFYRKKNAGTRHCAWRHQWYRGFS